MFFVESQHTPHTTLHYIVILKYLMLLFKFDWSRKWWTFDVMSYFEIKLTGDLNKHTSCQSYTLSYIYAKNYQPWLLKWC